MKETIRIAFIIITASTLLCCESPKQKMENTEVKTEEAIAQVTNDLPNLTINFLDGSKVHAKKLQGNSIIVLFFPDCDHCQREATQIQEQIENFKNYTLYFLSTSTKEEVDQFAVDYKLHRYENVKFGLITVEDVFSNFGSVPTPSLYIYSAEHKLIQKFNGETPIEAILRSVK